MAKAQKVRCRNWSIVTYLDIETLAQRLCAISNIRYYAFIEHDKDVNDDGTPKQRHVHLALVLNSARTVEQITYHFTDLYNNCGNAFGQPTKSNKAIIEYFTHKAEPDKHQYEESAIVSNNIDYFKNDLNEQDNSFFMLQDILQGKSLFELAKVYGKEFIYHYKQLSALVDEIKTQGKATPCNDLQQVD